VVTFGTVLARVFDRARPVVLLAVFPGEAWLAFALIPGTFMQALGFIFARFGYGARPFVLLTFSSSKTGFTFAFKIGSFMLAVSAMKAGISEGALSPIILAISTFEASRTKAFVVFSLIDTLGTILARLLGTASDVGFARFTLVSRAASAVEVFTFIGTFSFVQA
jgi:hypothetical protein